MSRALAAARMAAVRPSRALAAAKMAAVRPAGHWQPPGWRRVRPAGRWQPPGWRRYGQPGAGSRQDGGGTAEPGTAAARMAAVQAEPGAGSRQDGGGTAEPGERGPEATRNVGIALGLALVLGVVAALVSSLALPFRTVAFAEHQVRAAEAPQAGFIQVVRYGAAMVGCGAFWAYVMFWTVLAAIGLVQAARGRKRRGRASLHICLPSARWPCSRGA